MSSLVFDTHQFIRRLREAGMEEKQAEAIVEAFKSAQSEMQPVTRDYFDIKLNSEILKLKSEIEIVKSGLIKWVAGLLLAQAALIAALLKLFTGTG